MTNRSHRVIQQHSRPRKTHHLAYSLSHCRAITMCLTLRAECLLGHMRTTICSLLGISHQRPTLLTQLSTAVHLTTIECYHIAHYASFVLRLALYLNTAIHP